jgi:hypothetical protein
MMLVTILFSYLKRVGDIWWPNLKYSYISNSQDMLSIGMVSTRVFLRTYYAKYVMDSSITKAMYHGKYVL